MCVRYVCMHGRGRCRRTALVGRVTYQKPRRPVRRPPPPRTTVSCAGVCGFGNHKHVSSLRNVCSRPTILNMRDEQQLTTKHTQKLPAENDSKATRALPPGHARSNLSPDHRELTRETEVLHSHPTPQSLAGTECCSSGSQREQRTVWCAPQHHHLQQTEPSNHPQPAKPSEPIKGGCSAAKPWEACAMDIRGFRGGGRRWSINVHCFIECNANSREWGGGIKAWGPIGTNNGQALHSTAQPRRGSRGAETSIGSTHGPPTLGAGTPRES